MKVIGRVEHVRFGKNEAGIRENIVVKPRKSKREARLSHFRVMVINQHGKIETLAMTPLEYKKAVNRGRRGHPRKLHIVPNLLQYIIKWFLYKLHL